MWFLDAISNMYELSFGEAQVEAYENGDNMPLLYTLFLLSSFMLAIVFLNMLIAIMGDTFGKVTETRRIRRRITEMDKISEYVNLISRHDEADDNEEGYEIELVTL